MTSCSTRCLSLFSGNCRGEAEEAVYAELKVKETASRFAVYDTLLCTCLGIPKLRISRRPPSCLWQPVMSPLMLLLLLPPLLLVSATQVSSYAGPATEFVGSNALTANFVASSAAVKCMASFKVCPGVKIVDNMCPFSRVPEPRGDATQVAFGFVFLLQGASVDEQTANLVTLTLFTPQVLSDTPAD